MPARITFLAILLGVEILAGSMAFDGAGVAGGAGGPLDVLKSWGAWVLRWAVAALFLFGGFAFLQGRVLKAERLGPVIRPGWLGAHVAALAAFAAMSASIYGGHSRSGLAVIPWAFFGLLAVAAAAFTTLPPAAWSAWRRETGSLWLTASGTAALACWLGAASQRFWQPVTALTFTLTQFLLSLVTNDLITQPERFRIGTSKFTVIISQECSGLEGMGMMLIFALLWLVLFRNDLRFPHAFLLLPVGVAAIYLLNVLRIFALVVIGNAGWREIAVRGFHSQAGWIAFCLVALGILLASSRLKWLSARPAPEDHAFEYPSAPYLAPFMAILAAGILSQAMTADFEWTYSLRLLAAAICLWTFRRRYLEIDWRFGKLAVFAGCCVFLIWIGIDRLLNGGQGHTSMPSELMRASVPLQLAWLGTRIAGSVLAVPVAEELSFRGFGYRRLISADFQTVPWRSWRWMALGVSSLLFGAMHGRLWFAGIAAGAIYAWVMVRRGRLGDSIAAHATTNALLAAYVSIFDRWDLW